MRFLTDLLLTSVTMPLVMIGMPLCIRALLREKRSADTRRAVTTISRNILLTLPLVAVYVNTVRRYGLVSLRKTNPATFVSQFVLICLLMDTWFYWWHRALHTKALYEFHRHHHSFRPTTTLSYVAMSLFEFVFENLMYFGAPPVVWYYAGYDLSFWSWSAANLFLLVWASAFHSESLSFSVAYLNVNGPREHRIHHQFGMKNYNFSLIFLHWDKIMGTYTDVEKKPIVPS